MVDSVIASVNTTRLTIDTTFSLWYDEILLLAESIGTVECVPRKTSLQRNSSNTPSESPMERYKRVVAIPLLDSHISQMVERFSDERRQASNLLCLVPSMMLSSGINPIEMLEGMLHWDKDISFAKPL